MLGSLEHAGTIRLRVSDARHVEILVVVRGFLSANAEWRPRNSLRAFAADLSSKQPNVRSEH